MSYSFIKPKLKPIFSPFSKLWLSFIGLIFSIMMIFNIFILAKTTFMKSDIEDMTKQSVQAQKKIKKANFNIKLITQEKLVAEEIFASNEVLKDSMKNLFDLVPDQITLSKVLMEKNSLILYGSTPSKDIYNFLLASPLRSIFSTSQTAFYLNKNGWYHFVSTNKINNTDGLYE